MEKVETKTEECGYCYLTVCALLIAVFSAGLTLLIASYMYHGSYEPFELPTEIMTSKVKRLIVPHKKVIIFKVETKNRCYILPSAFSKQIPFAKFSFTNSSLSAETLKELTGPEGVNFCSSYPAFVLEKS